jgi:hypothetical protein
MAMVLYSVKHLRHTGYLYLAASLIIIFTVSLTLVVYLMWRKFQEDSYNYEVFAYQVVLEEKLRTVGSSGSAH